MTLLNKFPSSEFWLTPFSHGYRKPFQNRFAAFIWALKTFSMPFRNGFKPVCRNLLQSRILNRFRGVIKCRRKDAYGAIWRREHCWRFGAIQRELRIRGVVRTDRRCSVLRKTSLAAKAARVSRKSSSCWSSKASNHRICAKALLLLLPERQFCLHLSQTSAGKRTI